MRIIAFLILCLVAPLSAPLSAQDLVCTIIKTERKVEVSRNEGGYEPAVAPMKLAPGDKIHTGYKAVATVKFPDGSVLEVKPMSLVLLQKLDDADGKLKSRVWLKLGEVSANVGGSKTFGSDFKVTTPTSTASVRGTEIRRIAAYPGIGTIVEMGSHGLLSVDNHHGRTALPPRDLTRIDNENATPRTNEEVRLTQGTIAIQPAGTTEGERLDILDAGVPKTQSFAQGGTGFLSTMVTQTIQATTNIPPGPPAPARVIVVIPTLP